MTPLSKEFAFLYLFSFDNGVMKRRVLNLLEIFYGFNSIN